MQTPTKEVFLSYSDDDKGPANEFRDIMQQLFGTTVWMRDFDLNGGDLIANAIDEAITDAKWWVILLSKSALDCTWIKREATIGTFKSLEAENFKVIIVKLDNSGFPSGLGPLLSGQYLVDLSEVADREDSFVQIANYIEQFDITRPQQNIYEDRGADTDEFSLVTRRNKIAFVLGWRGIGKTAFVKNSITNLLGKKPLQIALTHEHSLDRLCRDILRVAHSAQPTTPVSDEELLNLSLRALSERAYRFYLFLDDAENGLDGSNRLLSYLGNFLSEFYKAKIDTHVILATTRNPDFPNEIADGTDIHRLGIIDDQYIEEIIYRWLEGSNKEDVFKNRPEDKARIIKVVGGHPLAAKRMASYLKLKTIEQLLEVAQRERFQLGFADFILRATQEALRDIHKLILKTLAAIQEPIQQSELFVIKRLQQQYSRDTIYQALWELTDWFLIEQKGEMIYLHDFLRAYYTLQLIKESDLRQEIANDYGLYAYHKAVELDQELAGRLALGKPQDELADISNEVFRYAVPADRLLRSIGKDSMADELPIRNQGTLRGMVYFFYQETDNYHKALEYAEKWLAINPSDFDISLYQIRCYRKIGGKANVEKGRQLILQLELQSNNHKKQFQIRLIREKALFSIIDGDDEVAEGFFRQAVQLDAASFQPYSEVYVGLARLLIKKADDQPEGNPEHQELAKEAVDLLEIAKKEPDNFYRFHLDAYAEALVQLGRDELAFPLLVEALQQRPDDGRLNFRMAEILRRKKEFNQAKEYAETAIKNNHQFSYITYANILCDEAIDLLNRNKRSEANNILESALSKVKTYEELHGKNKTDHSVEVADTIIAKIYRLRGDYDNALAVLEKHRNANNPYVVYERANLYHLKCQKENNNTADSLRFVQEGIRIIQEYKYKRPWALDELLALLIEKEKQVKANLGL